MTPVNMDLTDSGPYEAHKAFGKALLAIRELTGQSRTDVCRRTGGALRYSTFAAVEAGTRVPSAKTLPLMASGLGVLAADLQALWNALRTEESGDRIQEIWERLQSQARGDRQRREETASAIEEEVRRIVESRFEGGTGAEVAARAALDAYLTNTATVGAAVPARTDSVDNRRAAGAAVQESDSQDSDRVFLEPDYWQVSGAADWQPTEQEQEVLDIWNDLPDDRPRTEKLGEVFQGIRENEGWTIEEIADRLGLPASSVIGVEAGTFIPPTDLVRDMILSLKRPVQDTDHGIYLEGADGKPYLIEMAGPRGMFLHKSHLDSSSLAHIVWLLERITYGNDSTLDDKARMQIQAIVEIALLNPYMRQKIYERFTVSAF